MIRVKDGAPTERFEAYRAALQREGQRLIMFMAIYRRIHERRHDRLAALNIAPSFFQAVLASLYLTIIVRAHALFNGGGGTEESLRTFLNFAGRNISLFGLEQLASRKGWARDSDNMRHRTAPTYETVREDRKTIDRIASLKHIQTLRNKLHAHVDGEYFFDPGKAAVDASLRWSDLTELRTTFVNIVNRYSSAYDANTLIFEPVNIHDVDDVVEILHRSI
jgi:AbiU2